jgi:hypothetical protein
MNVVYSIQEDSEGRWRISQVQQDVIEPTSLGEAITQARQMGREEHARTGTPVSVEMVAPDCQITLAQYVEPAPASESARM